MNLPALSDIHNVLALHQVRKQIKQSDEISQFRPYY